MSQSSRALAPSSQSFAALRSPVSKSSISHSGEFVSLPAVVSGLSRTKCRKYYIFPKAEPLDYDIYYTWWIVNSCYTISLVKPTEDQPNIDPERKKSRSAVWNYFTNFVEIQAGKPAIYCKLCDAIIKHPSLK